jgi:carbon-monoxide dehydrogenase medium subunit
LVRAYEPALTEAFRHIATIRIRSQGTVGGNLAHADPAQDPPPILLVLDAVVAAVGPNGTRTIPLVSFFLDYFETVLRRDELIVSVRLPPRPPTATARYVKFLPRTHDDYATVGVAVSGTRGDDDRWHDVRIAIGAAGIPGRVPAAETALEGTALSASDVAMAADATAEGIEPIDDLRGSAAYKRDMARVWTRRALASLGAGGPAGEGAAGG